MSVKRELTATDRASTNPPLAPALPRVRPTIRAVAARAEVAISTVSRVVNGGSTSAAARQRVVQAIRELGYTPSVAAQSLVGRRTGCIGLVVNSTQSPWFTQILLGVEEALAPSRKSVVLASLMLSGQYDPAPVYAWIKEHRVDGLIFVRTSARDNALLEAAQEAGIDSVLIAPDLEHTSAFAVSSDNFHAGRLAATHLADRGHHDIGFGGGPRTSMDTRQRLSGARELLLARNGVINRHCEWYGNSYGSEAGRQHARSFLSMPREQRPSAMILGNDSMALAFMRELLIAGLSVPKDVSVVGFDGTPDGEQFWPSLTTVRQPTREMAAHACTRLLAGVDGELTEAVEQPDYRVELIIRESTAHKTDA